MALAIATPFAGIAHAQDLEFESGGLTYKTQTRGGVTVMFAPLPTRVLGYSILQVVISNGSNQEWVVRPEDFSFDATGGGRLQAISASEVVADVFNRAGRGDVGRLISVYEAALYGNPDFRSTNGYESRRKDAMAVGPTRMRAAAAASAIIMAPTLLEPGKSTDGAIFVPTQNQPLGAGTIRMITRRAVRNAADPLQSTASEGLGFDFAIESQAPPRR